MYRILDTHNLDKWDSFVQSHPLGSIFHHSSWIKVLTSTYKYKPILVAFENPKTGNIEGIIPFNLIYSLITGKRLVSLPFTSYCEILMPESQIRGSLEFILNKYKNINYLELKLLSESNHILTDYVPTNKFCTHILDLNPQLDDIFKSFHSTSIRQRVKRARRDQLTYRLAEDERDLKKFYELETSVRGKKGLPPSPYRFYLNIWKHLRPHNYVYLPVVEYDNKIIAAAIVLKFKKKYYLEYSASDSRYLKYSPNQFLIWETISMAHKNGADSFDFGRSSFTNKSLIDFKERWATQRIPLIYYYYPKSANNNEDGFTRKMLEMINKKMPNFLLKIEGNLLYPHLG